MNRISFAGDSSSQGVHDFACYCKRDRNLINRRYMKLYRFVHLSKICRVGHSDSTHPQPSREMDRRYVMITLPSASYLDSKSEIPRYCSVLSVFGFFLCQGGGAFMASAGA